jgi:hypothetical protein
MFRRDPHRPFPIRWADDRYRLDLPGNPVRKRRLPVLLPFSAIYSGPATCEFRAMQELVRTNDAVLISFIEALMRDAGIAYVVADQNMSVLDGSLGILPRRIMVEKDRIGRARTILADAGIGHEIETR